MLNKFSKVILFYLAYLPLILILLVLNLELTWRLAIYCGAALLLGLIPTLILLKTIKTVTPDSYKVKIIENKNTEAIGFIFTYLLPFCVEFTSINHLISFGLLMVIIFFIYIDTSLFSINPLLKVIFGYNIYESEIKMSDNIFEKNFLLSKDEEILKITRINIKQLEKGVMIKD